MVSPVRGVDEDEDEEEEAEAEDAEWGVELRSLLATLGATLGARESSILDM